MSQKLIMCRGLPGSGKSTFAKEYCKKMKKSVRINNDDLRASFYGREFNKVDENMITQVRTNLVTGYLDAGYDVVVDNTNLNPIHEEELKLIAEKMGAIFEIKEFPLSADECVVRDKARGSIVGEKVIRDMGSKWNYPKPIYTPVTQSFGTSCYIFDIDGTIADNSHRSPYNVEMCGDDKPIDSVIRLMNIIQGGLFPKYKIVLCSGRDEEFRGLTEKWLKSNNIKYDELFMRPANDRRKDDVIKHEILINKILPNYYVHGVFDDRDRVVSMYRQCGIRVFQVNYGNF